MLITAVCVAGWRAPELTRERECYLASPAADVYSAGLLLLHALKDVAQFCQACPLSSAQTPSQAVNEETLAAEVSALDQRYVRPWDDCLFLILPLLPGRFLTTLLSTLWLSMLSSCRL